MPAPGRHRAFSSCLSRCQEIWLLLADRTLETLFVKFDIDIAKDLSNNELVGLVKVAYEEMVRTYQKHSVKLHLYHGI